MKLPWTILHFGPIVGFVLALLLVVYLVRQERPPSSTIAWFLAILLVPYVGVPLYIMLGGRKMRGMAGRKPSLPGHSDRRQRSGEALSGAGEGLFPLRAGNSAELLRTGEQAYRSLMDAIASARRSICITTFLLGRDETGRAILDALADKARQGVAVYLLMDAIGSRKASARFLSGYRAAGGSYASFMPMLHLPFRGRANLRNHRKLVLVDGQSAIVGGMNLAREYMGPPTRGPRWRDLSMVVRGPAVADLGLVFRSDWEFASSQPLELPPVKTSDPAGGLSLQVMPSGPDVEGDFVYDHILTGVFNAQKRIWIVTPYFIPDDPLTKALCIAARRGLDVRVVVPAVSNHRLADLVRRGFLREVQEAGGTVWLFKPGMLHAKVILLDDSVSVLGSMNMDMRSLFLNYEIALIVHSQETAGQLADWVDEAVQDSQKGVREAAVGVQLLEGVCRLLSPLL